MNTRHFIAALSLACAASLAACGSASSIADSGVPTASVQKGDVQVKVGTTGEIRSTELRVLPAPPVSGGTLQITQLARTGTPVSVGDVIIQFDPTEQLYILAQNRNDLAQAEQEIAKAVADASVQTSQDKLALLKARFAVRRAELEVSKNELVSEIDGRKNILTLDDSKRALAQLEQDIKSHVSANDAALALSEEKKHKATLAIEQAESNIAKMTVKSPINGIVVRMPNRDAMGGMIFDGMSLPEYQVGDQPRPGTSVAQVINLSQLEVVVQANEGDRSLLAVGLPVQVRVTALPGEEFPASVKTIAGSSGHEFWDDNPRRTFEVTLTLAKPDQRFRPGYATRVTVLGTEMKGVLSVPSEAVFDQAGKTIVYLKKSGSFDRHEVKVRAYSEGRAVVEGLTLGDEVALVNPEKRANQKKGSSGGPALTAGVG